MKNEFRDTNSKDIWNNPLLCAQFLRGYTGVPLLEHVQPEDITDETERLRPFLGVEFEGDTVKKVRVRRPPGQDGREAQEESPSVYVVALIEHKSRVDYDVCFQMLKYMVGIWMLYRNDQDSRKPGTSRRKEFHYPLILPIVYYEGKENWTADLRWRDRVEYGEMFGEYVPDFVCRVVNPRSYSVEELLSREEELSLVMLFNRIQRAEDLDFKKWPGERRKAAQKILEKAPEAVLLLLGQIIHHLGLKINVPEDELRQYVKNVEDRNMGELWENMEKIDIQEERRKTAEAQKALAEKDHSLTEKDRTIAALQAEIARLKAHPPV